MVKYRGPVLLNRSNSEVFSPPRSGTFLYSPFIPFLFLIQESSYQFLRLTHLINCNSGVSSLRSEVISFFESIWKLLCFDSAMCIPIWIRKFIPTSSFLSKWFTCLRTLHSRCSSSFTSSLLLVLKVKTYPTTIRHVLIALFIYLFRRIGKGGIKDGMGWRGHLGFQLFFI